MVSTTRKVAGMPDLVLYKEFEGDPGPSKEPSVKKKTPFDLAKAAPLQVQYMVIDHKLSGCVTNNRKGPELHKQNEILDAKAAELKRQVPAMDHITATRLVRDFYVGDMKETVFWRRVAQLVAYATLGEEGGYFPNMNKTKPTRMVILVGHPKLAKKARWTEVTSFPPGMMDLLYPKDDTPLLAPVLVTLAQNTIITNQSPVAPPAQVPPQLVPQTGRAKRSRDQSESVPVGNPYDVLSVEDDDDESKVEQDEDKPDIEPPPSTPPRRQPPVTVTPTDFHPPAVSCTGTKRVSPTKLRRTEVHNLRQQKKPRIATSDQVKTQAGKEAKGDPHTRVSNKIRRSHQSAYHQVRPTNEQTHIHIHERPYTHTHIHKHTHMYTNTHTHVHTHMYTHTHTHTQTHTPTQSSSGRMQPMSRYSIPSTRSVLTAWLVCFQLVLVSTSTGTLTI